MPCVCKSLVPILMLLYSTQNIFASYVPPLHVDLAYARKLSDIFSYSYAFLPEQIDAGKAQIVNTQCEMCHSGSDHEIKSFGAFNLMLPRIEGFVRIEAKQVRASKVKFFVLVCL